MNSNRFSFASQLYILSGLVAMGLFSELDRLPLASGLTLLLLLAIIFLTPNPAKPLRTSSKKQKELSIQSPSSRPAWTIENLWISIVILTPSFLLWLRQWTMEFPFSGDHDHHTFATLAARGFWTQFFWVPLIWLGLAHWLRRQKEVFRYWSLVVFAVLWLISLSGQVPQFYFARYPAFAYLLASPILYLADLVQLGNLALVNQTTQFLSLPVWLLALRPLLVKKWPDQTSLFLGLFLYWQKDFLHYQTSGYLEPWSLVMMLLGLEMALSSNGERWRAFLVFSMATWFKETSVLFLPFFWLGLYGGEIKKRGRQAWPEAGLVGLSALMPFVFYYQLRVVEKIWRQSEVTSDWTQIFSSSRLNEFGFRLLEQWHYSGLLLLALTFYAWFMWLKKLPQHRTLALSLFGASLFVIGFFYVDQISLTYTGYPRFYLPVYVMISSVWIGLNQTDIIKNHKRTAVAVLASLQLISLVPFLKKSFGVSSEQSYSEHYDSPVYFPIRELLRESKGLHKGDQILVVSPIANLYPQSFSVGYRDLIQQWRIQVVPLSEDSNLCRCGAQARAVMMLSSLPVGLKASQMMQQKEIKMSQACVEQITISCQNKWEKTQPDGQLSGVIGVAAR